MSEEQVLIQSPLMYRLVRSAEGALFLDVVVGGIAQFTVRVVLTAQEADAYGRLGRPYADRLAMDVMASPAFGGRAIRVP
ncbi:hypothetical protein HUW63_17360 [Myxococcus sp. AM001]|uniref:hypothetical protein n=1 Tax=Myxococcus TaxID=32 RepID=UPI0013D53B15|nr:MULTISPECIES: hypothetical protein [Myxococcus]NVJ07007.1 hypothetical protein [Myxococcus sp. AM001]WIG93723.1 hypothetical protein KGD87_24505 [Myxococcus sp. SDU36]